MLACLACLPSRLLVASCALSGSACSIQKCPVPLFRKITCFGTKKGGRLVAIKMSASSLRDRVSPESVASRQSTPVVADHGHNTPFQRRSDACLLENAAVSDRMSWAFTMRLSCPLGPDLLGQTHDLPCSIEPLRGHHFDDRLNLGLYP